MPQITFSAPARRDERCIQLLQNSKLWKIWQALTRRLEKLPAPDINLFARLYIAQIFFLSGRTKVAPADDEGFWASVVAFMTPAEHAIMLFEEEYAVPILPPELAAQLALLAETFVPILLIFGLFTRLSAFSLVLMTLVIQLFVYPNLWHEHMIWIASLLLLVATGGGQISLDRLIVGKYIKKR